MYQRAKYLGQKSFNSTVHTYKHTQPTAAPEPRKWSVKKAYLLRDTDDLFYFRPNFRTFDNDIITDILMQVHSVESK